MNEHLRILLFWLLGSVLLSCSVGVQNANPDYALDENGKRGLVAFSLSYSGDNFTLRYWSLDDDDSRGEIVARAKDVPLDWSDPPTRLVFFELPAGNYEFYEGIDVNGPMSERTAPFSIPFETMAGKVSYLGNIYYDRTLRAAKHKTIITDRSPRDIPRLLQKLPNVREEQVTVGVVSVGDPQ